MQFTDGHRYNDSLRNSKVKEQVDIQIKFTLGLDHETRPGVGLPKALPTMVASHDCIVAQLNKSVFF